MKTATLRSNLLVLLLSLLSITPWAGCTGKTESSNEGSGTLVYRLSWNTESSMASDRPRTQSVTGNVCADYHIEWIHAVVLDPDGESQARGKWPCSQRKGELTGIASGTYNFRLEGEVAGKTTWRGEASDLEVTEKESTDAGVIVMRHLTDHDPPVVARTLPNHEAQDVPIDSTVTVTFDDVVVAQSIDVENFTLTYTDPLGEIQSVAGEIRYEKENHTAVMTPTAALMNDTTYTAAISVDAASVVQDIAGNPMQETFQWHFTTFKPDGEGPRVISRAPEKDTMDVAPSAIVQVRFSEPVEPQTISNDSVRLEHHGASLQCDIRYDGQLNMVTLTPVGGLPLGATITVAVTTDVLDAGGDKMAAADSWSFVTEFPPWHTESITAGGAADGTARIALETNHSVHIAIRQAYDGQAVDLIRISENEWSDWVLSDPTGIGLPFDMAIDAIDMRYVVYAEKETNLFEINARGLVGGGIGHGLLEMDDPMTNLKSVSFATVYNKNVSPASICFYDASDAQLKLYTGNTPLTGETVDTAGGEHCAVATSVDEVSHLSYHDRTNRHLRYATRTPDGVWSKETVDEGTAVGVYTAIAPDSAGRPHICYRDESNTSLKYAYLQPSGQWLIETVDDGITIGDGLSIGVDSLGQAHISYRDSVNEALKYAVRTGIGRWHTRLVDTDGWNGIGASIAVDSQDYVHISYCAQIANRAGFQVRYATTRP